MGELEGKVAVVTGCGRPRGIGRACANALAGEGAAVVLSDLCTTFGGDLDVHGTGTWEALNEAAEGISAAGGRAHVVKCDVTIKEDVETMIQEAVDTFGGIDILVNNAGCAVGIGPLPLITEAAWDKTMAVNVKGPMLCTQAALPHFIQRGGGKVVMMSSQAGIQGGARYGAYAASKHAVIGLTQVLGAELAPYNIQVNAICPGLVDTDLGFEQYGFQSELSGMSVEEVREELVKLIPAGRFETPEDVADVCLFLSSARSNYVVGERIIVTGGFRR